jgi:UTP--glucose-1-phosphate uridylyltransferase
VNNEPFLLLLGDHIYRSHLNINCTAQLLQVYQQVNHSIIGLRKTAGEQIHHYGCVTGDFDPSSQLLSITQIYEKPTLDYARSHLQIDGMAKDEFLSIFGLYVLEPKIFEILQAEITENRRDKGEFQLTSCLEKLRQEELMTGVCIQGSVLIQEFRRLIIRLFYNLVKVENKPQRHRVHREIIYLNLAAFINSFFFKGLHEKFF